MRTKFHGAAADKCLTIVLVSTIKNLQNLIPLCLNYVHLRYQETLVTKGRRHKKSFNGKKPSEQKTTKDHSINI